MYLFFFLCLRPPPISTLFPYTTLFRSRDLGELRHGLRQKEAVVSNPGNPAQPLGTTKEALDCFGLERSEEHTSELQSLRHLVCRLLLEKKKKNRKNTSA